jgi:hypothetical protein
MVAGTEMDDATSVGVHERVLGVFCFMPEGCGPAMFQKYYRLTSSTVSEGNAETAGS